MAPVLATMQRIGERSRRMTFAAQLGGAAAVVAQAILFAESNHRIKNNLQMIAAFLTLESRAAASEDTAATLRSAAARLIAVGQIHDRLTHTNGESIDLDDLLSAVCAHLSGSVADGARIGVTWESETRTVLPAGPATAICLLANELVTNALKHAFPDDQMGSVAVRLGRDGEDLVLTVADDGRGLADPVGGSGLRFVDAISQDLDGVIRVVNEGGTRVEIRMPVPEGATAKG